MWDYVVGTLMFFLFSLFLIFYLGRRSPAPAVAVAPSVLAWRLGANPNRTRVKVRALTTAPVTGLGQFAIPCWSDRARHIGIVTAIRGGSRPCARLTLVNRERDCRMAASLNSLRRVEI